MKRNFNALIFAFCFLWMGIGESSAQDPINTHTGNFWSRVRFGGGLGFGLTNGGFNASVVPSAIYEITPQFAAGAGLNFNYAKYGDAKRVAYGASVLSFYNPVQFLQLSAEFEQLRINYKFGSGPTAIEDNYWSPALFFGAGFRTNNVTFGVRYNVLYDTNRSIYANGWEPFVRVYF